jgi:hypothetical protein
MVYKSFKHLCSQTQGGGSHHFPALIPAGGTCHLVPETQLLPLLEGYLSTTWGRMIIMPVKAYYFTPGRKRKFSINFNTLFLFRLLSIFIKYFLLTVENSSRRTDQCQVRMKTFSD